MWWRPHGTGTQAARRSAGLCACVWRERVTAPCHRSEQRCVDSRARGEGGTAGPTLPEARGRGVLRTRCRETVGLACVEAHTVLDRRGRGRVHMSTRMYMCTSSGRLYLVDWGHGRVFDDDIDCAVREDPGSD